MKTKKVVRKTTVITQKTKKNNLMELAKKAQETLTPLFEKGILKHPA